MLQSFFQPLLSLNGSLFMTIHNPAGHGAVLDKLMELVAQDLIYVYALLVLLLWWIPGGRSTASRAERSVSREAVLWTIAAVILALIINISLGALLPEPRPFVSDHFQPLIAHSADASFPSDHAAISFAIAGVLLIRYWLARRVQPLPPVPGGAAYRKTTSSADQTLTRSTLQALRWRTGLLAVLGLLVAIAIGYARIYVGVHYPLDILGGALIGLVAALIILLARGLIRPVARLVESGARMIHLA